MAAFAQQLNIIDILKLDVLLQFVVIEERRHGARTRIRYMELRLDALISRACTPQLAYKIYPG